MIICDAISAYLGISSEQINTIVERAPKLYRKYSVPKKRGGRREIYHPARETKAVQIAAINLLYRGDLVSNYATAYIRGISSPLVKNASIHSNSLFLLRLDFNDFFPSIKPDDFKSGCACKLSLHGNRLGEKDIDFLSKLFFIYNTRLGWFLGIGAPSSPFISNWVMFNLDQEISALCDMNGCNYSRYADDLYFSSDSKQVLLETENKIKDIVEECPNPRLTFNDGKRTLASKWSKRRVAGLSLTPAGEVKVPRDLKRYIRGLLNNYKKGSLSPEGKASLSGYLAFIKDCEPTYINNLAIKFGSGTIKSAFEKK